MPKIRPCPICAEWRLVSLVDRCPICKAPGAKPELDALILKFTNQYRALGGAHPMPISYDLSKAIAALTHNPDVQKFCDRHHCNLRVWEVNKDTFMLGFTGPTRECAAVFETPEGMIDYCVEDELDLGKSAPTISYEVITSPSLIAEADKRKIAANPSAVQIWEFLSYDGKLSFPPSKFTN